MQKFAAFDIDGTIYRYALYHDLVDCLIEDGAIPMSAKKLFEQQHADWKNRTHQDSFNKFAYAHVSMFEQQLPNVQVPAMHEAAKKVLARNQKHTYVYTRDLIKQLKADGYFLIAISGSMAEIAHPFARLYGFDEVVSTEYHTKDGVYTGTHTKRHDDKHKILEAAISEHELTLKGSIAVGDSRGDISMLAMVEHPIAFNPEHKLFEEATDKKWKIVVERKNMIYELEPHNGQFVLAKTDK